MGEKAMIAKMDATDKKDQAELDTMAKSTGKADHELKKSQSILKMLRKKTRRRPDFPSGLLAPTEDYGRTPLQRNGTFRRPRATQLYRFILAADSADSVA